jgi:hypothetical protein
MKYLLILLISFNSFASYIAIPDLETCEKADLFSHKEICETDKKSECLEYVDGSFCQSLDLITDEDGKKSLVENADKKAAHLAKLKQIEDAQKIEADKKALAKEKLKTFDKSKITTVAAARDWIAEIVEILK